MEVDRNSQCIFRTYVVGSMLALTEYQNQEISLTYLVSMYQKIAFHTRNVHPQRWNYRFDLISVLEWDLD